MNSTLLGLALLATYADEPDKMQHMIAGGVTSAIVTEYTGDPVKGCLVGLALGAAKEAYDARRGGNVEARDIAATSLGGCFFTWQW